MNKILTLTILTMSLVSGVAYSYGYGDTTNFYDEWGVKTGSARQEYGGQVSYYDEWGTKKGSARQEYGGKVNYYDEWGNKVGSSETR